MATILIVEDNKPLNGLYAEVLRMAGFEALQATNCKEAIDCLQRVVPDVIVLDMLLPDGNGRSVIDHLREHRQLQNTHLIVSSGYEDQMNEADRLAVDCFLVKPVSVPNLVDCVGRLVSHRMK